MSFPIVTAGDRAPFIEGWTDVRSLPRGLELRSYVVQSLCHITDLSQQAVEQLGESYRGFKVGSAVLALDTKGGRSGIYFGGNYTPHKGAPWNCAEKRAFENVAEHGFGTVAAVAVTGPLQADSESGIESPTLHPCYRCRHMLVTSPLTGDKTLIVTSNLSGTEYELFTAESLQRLHSTGEPQPLPDYHPSLPFYWEQLKAMDEDTATYRAETAILSRMAKNHIANRL